MAEDDILKEEEVSSPIVATETANQVFIRILGYLQIEQVFINTILQSLRIRSFRLATILDDVQMNEISELAKASEDMAFDLVKDYSRRCW